MAESFTAADAKAGACAYVLHCLLQRLELQSPGLVLDLLNGVKADQVAIQNNQSLSVSVKQVFSEAVDLLERCHAQNQSAATNF